MRFFKLYDLFPLDRGDGLGAELVQDTADAGDLTQDAVGYLLEQRPVKLGHGCACCVNAVDRTDDDRPHVGTLAVTDTRCTVVGNGGEVLPDVVLKPCGGYLLTQNCVRLTHGLEAVTGDSAGASYAETRAGEGLAIDHAVGQTERLADDTNLVLVQ